MPNIQRIFTIDGEPFFPLGGQVHNSSAYTPAELETAWRALELLRANTAEIPVYWEQIEPREGVFNFSMLDHLLEAARQRNLRLILLWFGTWKNGMMKFAPDWVKAHPQRFQRVIGPAGEQLAVLSSHCQANQDADRRALCALLEHLRQHDSQQTVIAIQVENEPGILGSDRDYGTEAELAFHSPAPPSLTRTIAQSQRSMAHTAWQNTGARPSGTWPELFGSMAGEIFSAWSIARYIDDLIVAGKAVYNLPMFVNVWLGEEGWRVPGLSYPAGGPTTSVLEIWKWAAPHVDLIAPDIYLPAFNAYRGVCANYSRPDNPLFIPESAPDDAGALYMFSALADYNAIGYAIFGVERILGPDGNPRPEARALIGSFHCAAAALPLLLEYQEIGGVHAVVQEERQGEQYLDLGEYIGMIRFASHDTVRRDFHHLEQISVERGRGLVFQGEGGEFYVVGAGFRLMLRKRTEPRSAFTSTQAPEQMLLRMTNYLHVEEGHFAADGSWVVDRRRNGDESDFGIWVQPDVGVVRVVVGD